MKYLVILPLILLSCSTLPNRELQDCQDVFVRFYKQHHQPIPYDDIKDICERDMFERRRIERNMNRR